MIARSWDAASQPSNLCKYIYFIIIDSHISLQTIVIYTDLLSGRYNPSTSAVSGETIK